MGDQHWLCRFLPAGAAVNHPGADLVPLHSVQVGVGAVPVRPFYFSLLGFYHHHGVFLGARHVLRLDVSVWRAERNVASHRRGTRHETLPAQTADQTARPPEMDQVRRLCRPARCFLLFNGSGRGALRSRTVQDDFPRRRVEPQLAVRPLLGGFIRCRPVCRAFFLQISLPARRGTGHSLDLPLVGVEAQG